MCGPDDEDREDDELNAKARDKISPKEFAAPGKLPIENAAHVRAAMARFGETEFKAATEKKAAFKKIVAKAKELDVDSSGFEKSWQGRLDEGAGSHRKDSNVMNLEQALAALNAANEKVGAEKARADAADKALETEKAERTRLQARVDSLTTELADEKKARKDAADMTPAQVKAKVALLTNASAVVGPKLKRNDGVEVPLIDIPDRDLKLAVIKHVENVDCDVDHAGKKRDDVYIGARYDAAIERGQKSGRVFADVGAHILGNRMREDSDGNGNQADDLAKARAETAKARKDMVEFNQNGRESVIAGNGKKGE